MDPPPLLLGLLVVGWKIARKRAKRNERQKCHSQNERERASEPSAVVSTYYWENLSILKSPTTTACPPTAPPHRSFYYPQQRSFFSWVDGHNAPWNKPHRRTTRQRKWVHHICGDNFSALPYLACPTFLSRPAHQLDSTRLDSTQAESHSCFRPSFLPVASHHAPSRFQRVSQRCCVAIICWCCWR